MIQVDELRYRAPQHKMYANGRRVVEAYANGVKVYPVELANVIHFSSTVEDEQSYTLHRSETHRVTDGESPLSYLAWLQRAGYGISGYEVFRTDTLLGRRLSMWVSYYKEFKRRYGGHIDVTIESSEPFCMPGGPLFTENEDREIVFAEYDPDPATEDVETFWSNSIQAQPFISNGAGMRRTRMPFKSVWRRCPIVRADATLKVTVNGRAYCEADFHAPGEWWEGEISATNPYSRWFFEYRGFPTRVSQSGTLRMDDPRYEDKSSDFYKKWQFRMHNRWFVANDNILVHSNNVMLGHNSVEYHILDYVAVISDPPGELYYEEPGSFVCPFPINGYEIETV